MKHEIDNLPHPEDLSAENELEFIGLYMWVYCRYVHVSKAITARISGDLDQDRRLGDIASITEAPLERWLNQADEFLPEWFNRDLLVYGD